MNWVVVISDDFHVEMMDDTYISQQEDWISVKTQWSSELNKRNVKLKLRKNSHF